MYELIQSFLDNESRFGRLMTRAGIIIGANLMFVVFSLPGITIGAGWAALYYVMLKTLRGSGTLNPFREFWKGFRDNFRQATLCWIVFLLLAVICWMDLRICNRAGGYVSYFRYGIYAVGFVIIILVSYLMPVMAAFKDTIPHLIRNAFFFAFKNPVKMVGMLFIHTVPMIITYSDLKSLPLYAFLWCFIGFGAVAMAGASMMLAEFSPFLDSGNEKKESDGGGEFNDDEQRMLEEMMKLDGM